MKQGDYACLNELQKSCKNLLCIDHGGQTSGIAVSGCDWAVAFAVEDVISGAMWKQIKPQIQQLIKIYNVCAIVIGWPVSMSGNDQNRRCHAVNNFAQMCQKSFDMPVFLQDERLSSQVGLRILEQAGELKARPKSVAKAKRSTKPSAQRKKQLDTIAAAYILQTFLDTYRAQKARNTCDSHAEDDYEVPC